MAEFNELVIELQGQYAGVTQAFKELTQTLGNFSDVLRNATPQIQQYQRVIENLGKVLASQKNFGKQTTEAFNQAGNAYRRTASDVDILYRKITRLATVYEKLGQKSTARQLRSLGAEALLPLRQREAISALYDTKGLSKSELTALNVAIMAGVNRDIKQTAEVSDIAADKVAELQRELNKLATAYAKLGQVNRAAAVRQYAGGLRLGEQQANIQSLIREAGLQGEQVAALNDVLLNPAQIGQIAKGGATAIEDIAQKARRANTSLSEMMFNIGKLGAALHIFKRIGIALANMTKEAIDFVETLNLFQTALGEYATQATDFVNRMSVGLGISETTLMKYTGLFYQMATSMGVANDQAYIIAENFTKLALDIASYFNITIEQANEKLQAALAGQIRPLREIGIDISKSALQEEARRRGIQKSIEAMTTAEKRMLIYSAVIRQTRNAHGDFVKTIETVANQSKLLSENIIMLKKAWGEILMPTLEKVLPIVNGLLSGLTYLGESLARIAGYKVREFGGALNALDALDEEGENALETMGKLQKAVMGFDELNILSNKKTDDSFNIQLEEYDNGLHNIRNVVEKIGGLGLALQKAFKGFGEILEKVAPLTVLLGTTLATYFGVSFLGKIAAGIGKIGMALTGAFSMGTIGAVASLVAGVAALIAYFDRIQKERIAEKVAQQLGGLSITAAEADVVIGDLDGTLSDLYQNSLQAQEKLKPIKEGLDEAKRSADDFLSKFDKLSDEIPDHIDEIINAVDGMTNSAKDAFLQAHNIIYGGWEELFRQSGNVIDESEQALLDKIKLQGDGVAAVIEDIGRRIKEIYEQMANDATGSVEKQMEEIKRLRQLQYDLANEPILIEQEKKALERAEIMQKIRSGEYSADALKDLAEQYLDSLQESINNFNSLVKQRQAEINVKTRTRQELLAAGYTEDYLASIGYSQSDLDAMQAALDAFITSQRTQIGDETTWQAILDSLEAKKKTTASEMVKKLDEVAQRYEENAPWYILGIYKIAWAQKQAEKELGYSTIDIYNAVLAEKQANDELQKIIDELMKRYSDLPAYASGGFPASGQMFIANEGGNIEMIGKIGSQPVVANNQQIIEGVKQGVALGAYEAFVNALKDSGGLNANLYIGYEKIAQATEVGNRKIGKTFSTIPAGGNVI